MYASRNNIPDYNLLSVDDINDVLKLPIEHAIGKREMDRIRRVLGHYDYYSGKQHQDEFGNYVSANELDRPDGMDYDPSRFHTNYFKAFIKRKARWQMGGTHGISVNPKSQEPDDIDHAKKHQELLYKLHDDNNMERDKIRIARDRLIAGQVVAKIIFNQRTGILHWIWHKATEVFFVYSDDGFNDVIGVNFIVPQEDPENENKTDYWVQRFWMNDDYTDCLFEEILYDEQLNIKRRIADETSLGIDFIPAVSFDVNDLITDQNYNDDVEDMISLTTMLNRMMEDASDSLRFEMFNTLVAKNAEPGTVQSMKIAPGAAIEINSNKEGVPAELTTLENHFQWREAFNNHYSRIKAALHEISGLPQIVPQELNFGGLNDRALQVLYQDIIQETEEHWLLWDYSFKKLHEKSVKYLQARTDSPKFEYDVDIVNSIEDYRSEMNFALPLPDDRETLVELLQLEVDNGFESQHGALRRLGVQDVEGKIDEMREERVERARSFDPYGSDVGNESGGETQPVERGLIDQDDL